MIKRFLSSHPLTVDYSLFLLRISFGGLLAINHGWDKLVNFDDYAADFPSVFGMSTKMSLTMTVVAEFFCALLVVAGFFTRPALIFLIICFAVIVFKIQINNPFSEMEHGILYLVVFIGLFLKGPGKFSIDNLIFKH